MITKRTRVLCIAAITGFVLCGCVTPRWQVYQSEYSYDAEGEKESKYFTRNTILVDSKTGKTWILSPSDEGDEADYYWIEMRKK